MLGSARPSPRSFEMITADLLRAVPLFASLPTSELETLAARGADIHLRAGD